LTAQICPDAWDGEVAAEVVRVDPSCRSGYH
jgi:hypothetical protein